MLIVLGNFVRQPVTNLGKLVLPESFSQTSDIIPLTKNLLKYSLFSRWEWMIDSFCSFPLYGYSCLLWLLFLFGKLSVNGKVIQKTCYKLFAIIVFALLQSSRFHLHVRFFLFYRTIVFEMPALIQDKNPSKNCSTQTARNNFVRQKKGCSAGTLYCTRSPIFSITSTITLTIILLKKRASQNLSLRSNVIFLIKSYQHFTLYINIKTSTMAFLSRQQLLIRTISSTKLMMQILKRSCAHVIISWSILSLKRRDTTYSIT